MTTKFVYSLSSKPYPNRMVKDAIRSIESLKNWVNPKNVEIFYTPPHETEDIKKLRKTGAKVNVIESELPEFRLNFLEKKYGYGEMWNLCRVQSENVVWLDTDTIITKDIWDIVEGDFDFKAYPEESPDSQSWRDMFKRNGSSPMGWMINSGFVIFKNNIHREIKEQWKIY